MKIKNIFLVFSVIIFFLFIFLYLENKKTNNKYFIEGLKLNSKIILKNSKGKNIYLKDIELPILVINYSELNCGVCADSIIASVKRIKKKIPHIYITDYKQKRDLYLFKRVNQIRDEVYISRNKTDIDTLNVPYVYVLKDKNLIQNSFFIPHKENIADFDKYLSEISKHYWN